MATVYVLGDGVVTFFYEDYLQHCKENGITPAYEPPKGYA